MEAEDRTADHELGKGAREQQARSMPDHDRPEGRVECVIEGGEVEKRVCRGGGMGDCVVARGAGSGAGFGGLLGGEERERERRDNNSSYHPSLFVPRRGNPSTLSGCRSSPIDRYPATAIGGPRSARAGPASASPRGSRSEKAAPSQRLVVGSDPLVGYVDAAMAVMAIIFLGGEVLASWMVRVQTLSFGK